MTLLLLPLLEVKIYQGIDDELVDNEAQRGTAKRAGEGLCHSAEVGILCRVVGHREGRAGGVSGNESKVWRRMAAVSPGNEDTSARINEPLQEGVARAHDVVSGVFMKYRSEHRMAEETV